MSSYILGTLNFVHGLFPLTPALIMAILPAIMVVAVILEAVHVLPEFIKHGTSCVLAAGTAIIIAFGIGLRIALLHLPSRNQPKKPARPVSRPFRF
ncbi:hypothetical protein [Thiolapillus sp.]|uniref:hypothetical protein n=1 Tax=Thiolapillus sp. TaxID=2017437 RepID=UPI003AF7F89C